jgi:hypothetical protein
VWERGKCAHRKLFPVKEEMYFARRMGKHVI